MLPVMQMPNPVLPLPAPHPHQRTNSSVGSMQMVSQMNGWQMSIVLTSYGLFQGVPMPRPVSLHEKKTLYKFIDIKTDMH